MKINEFKAAYDLNWAIDTLNKAEATWHKWIEQEEQAMKRAAEQADADMYYSAREYAAELGQEKAEIEQQLAKYTWAHIQR